MNQSLKLVVFGVSCLVIGGGSYAAWNEYSRLQQENAALRIAPSPSTQPSQDTITSSPSSKPATSSATPEGKKMAPQTGIISGVVGYPSEGIPPVDIYAMKQDDYKVFYKVSNPQNQSTFSISDIPVGTYVVVAYPKLSPTFAGSYTKAVPCGLLASCTDHTMIPVVVTAGKNTDTVEVKDWYVPEGTFPVRPE